MWMRGARQAQGGRRGVQIRRGRVPDELVEVAIRASPGLARGYQFTDSDLRTDVRLALEGVLACLQPRPRRVLRKR
jgi:hypothetical protein